MADNYLILCPSTSHMIKAVKKLTEKGITVDQVPVPASAGTICSTAIKVAAESLAQAKAILLDQGIAVSKVLPEKPVRLRDFLHTLKKGDEKLKETICRIGDEEKYEASDIIRLLSIEEDDDLAVLFKAADKVRSNTIGDTVEIRGAIEFSNYCQRECCYCGVRRCNQKLERYRMSTDEIIQEAQQLYKQGIRTVILQSGEDPAYNTEAIIRIIEEIKRTTAMRITLSIGERLKEEYMAFRKAGANNYLLKIETTNARLYKEMHPESQLDIRIEHTKWLKEIGYIVGSGNIIGLPGQSVEDIARDILWFKEQQIHMLGIGPFIPAAETPLARGLAGSVLGTLKAMAVARLMCKNAFIPSTTALATLDKNAQKTGLKVGANTIMLISTPERYKKKYKIYKNKFDVNLEWALRIVDELGRKRPRYLREVN